MDMTLLILIKRITVSERPSMSHSSSIKKSSTSTLRAKGIQLFNELSEQLKKLNINSPAFDETAPFLFMELNEDQITEIFNSIQQTINNLVLSVEKTRNQDNLNVNQLWSFLAENKLKYPIDLFDYVTKGDILEVYDNENKQVFRSFDFFRHSTYSLDELFSTPWNELYYRDEIYIHEYMHLLSVLIENKSKDVLLVKTVPPHWVSQLKTNRKASHYLQTKIICLVYDAQDNIKGYIHTQKILDPAM